MTEKHRQLIEQKLERLREARILATDASVQFKLDHEIEELEAKLAGAADNGRTFAKRPTAKPKEKRNFIALIGVIIAAIVLLFGNNLLGKFLWGEEGTTTQTVATTPLPPISDTNRTKILDTLPVHEGKQEPKSPELTKVKTEESIPPVKANLRQEQEQDKPAPEIEKIAPLSISCTTNKGNNKPQFQAGETAVFYYQVNRPCYVRVIGKLVDGRCVLLEEQKVVEASTEQQLLLGEFTVEPPLGEEEVYFFASLKAFPDLVTSTSADGYEVITEGLPKALRKTRGFKLKNAFAEAKLETFTYE